MADLRSRKVIFLAHCLLNQNSVVVGSAKRAGPVAEVLEGLIERGVGIVQLPCPEITHYGLRRFWAVKEQYNNPGFRSHCKELATRIEQMISEYQRNGYAVVALVGIKGSPSCGISEVGSSEDWMGPPFEAKKSSRVPSTGVFMEELLARVEGLRLVEWDWNDVQGSVGSLKGAIGETEV